MKLYNYNMVNMSYALRKTLVICKQSFKEKSTFKYTVFKISQWYVFLLVIISVDNDRAKVLEIKSQ